jgi:hypothetical protein
MKAIINTKKSSGLSYLNGQTFEVIRINEASVTLATPNQVIEGRFDSVDFSFNEIFIVDIKNELKWVSDGKTFQNLMNYVTERKMLQFI